MSRTFSQYLPLLLTLCLGLARAGEGTEKPAYPVVTPDAPEIARQIYFVNHLHAVQNLRFGERKHPIVLIDYNGREAPRVMTMVRQLNNDYADGVIRARDLVIFRSGKLKGTGILVTDYLDPARSLSFSVWLPALRKIRRHAEPDQEIALLGSACSRNQLTGNQRFVDEIEWRIGERVERRGRGRPKST